MYRIFGRNPKESGASYNKLLNYIYPDDRDYLDNFVKKALTGIPFSIECRLITANKKERTVHAETEIIFDERNNPIRMRGILQDITEQKKAEEKLRDSEEKYRNIVETSNEGIYLVDDEAIITYANKI